MNEDISQISMMVFIIDKDERVLLKNTDRYWTTYAFDSTGEINIREMVCSELYKNGIYTEESYLQYQEVIDVANKSIFIYTLKEFATNSPFPSSNSFWHRINEINYLLLPSLEKRLIPRILKEKKVGI